MTNFKKLLKMPDKVTTILSDQDTNDDGNDNFWYKTEFHENKPPLKLQTSFPPAGNDAFDFSVYSVYYGHRHKSN